MRGFSQYIPCSCLYSSVKREKKKTKQKHWHGTEFSVANTYSYYHASQLAHEYKKIHKSSNNGKTDMITNLGGIKAHWRMSVHWKFEDQVLATACMPQFIIKLSNSIRLRFSIASRHPSSPWSSLFPSPQTNRSWKCQPFIAFWMIIRFL